MAEVKKVPALTPEEVLKIVAALLGSSQVDGEGDSERQASSSILKRIVPADLRKLWDATESVDNGEISSFPSFKLDHHHSATATMHSSSSKSCSAKEQVQSHVASLLARPILVGNDDDDEDNSSEDDCTVVKNLKEVPDLMLNNFYRSLCTLVDARLRAYAKFLANHGLSLVEEAREPETESDAMEETTRASNQNDSEKDNGSAENDAGVTAESVAGLGHKLGNLLDIGNHVSADAVVTTFSIPTSKSTREKKENDAECVIMPLVMEVFIDITIPHPSEDGEKVENFCTTVSFRASGNIQGTFSRTSSSGTGPLDRRLSAIDVEINADELLLCMTKQAAHIVSIIVELTNAAGKGNAATKSNSVEDQTPESCGDSNDNNCEYESANGAGDIDKIQGSRNAVESIMSRPKRRLSFSGSVVTPVGSPDLHVLMSPENKSSASVQKRRLSMEETSSLSPKRCANIVDKVMGEVNDQILMPSSLPRRKRVRIL